MKDYGALLWLMPAILAGVCVAVQTGVNSQLRLELQSPLQAALISFVVGTFVLMLILVARNEWRIDFGIAKEAPWWIWTGGVLGAFYVSSIVFVAPKIGAVAVSIYIIFGQLITSTILDHHGWLGFPKIAISAERIIGILLVLIGVILVAKSPVSPK